MFHKLYMYNYVYLLCTSMFRATLFCGFATSIVIYCRSPRKRDKEGEIRKHTFQTPRRVCALLRDRDFFARVFRLFRRKKREGIGSQDSLNVEKGKRVSYARFALTQRNTLCASDRDCRNSSLHFLPGHRLRARARALRGFARAITLSKYAASSWRVRLLRRRRRRIFPRALETTG